MGINFFRGSLKSQKEDAQVVWAEIPQGCVIPGPEEGSVIYIKKPKHSGNLIFRLEIPELDRESLESIAENILRKGLPPVSADPGQAESALFIVVNEAIHRLEEIRKKSSSEL